MFVLKSRSALSFGNKVRALKTSTSFWYSKSVRKQSQDPNSKPSTSKNKSPSTATKLSTAVTTPKLPSKAKAPELPTTTPSAVLPTPSVELPSKAEAAELPTTTPSPELPSSATTAKLPTTATTELPATSTTKLPVSKRKAKGVVFMLGWIGCTHQQLVKYRILYQDLGFIVVTFSPSFFAIFNPLPTRKLRIQCRRLLTLGGDDAKKTVFIHAFSYSGCFMMRLLMDEMSTREGIRLQGCIMDSGPTPLTIASAYRLLNSLFPYLEYVTPVLAPLFTWYLRLCYHLNRLVDFIAEEHEAEFWHWRHCDVNKLAKQMDYRCPQLCMYSKNDLIARGNYVQMFGVHRINRRINIKLCPYPDSEHVGHLNKYPERYISMLRHFVLYRSLKQELD